MDDINRLPLGLCKQVVLKLSSAMTDIQEILTDEDVNEEDRDTFATAFETIALVNAHIVNIVHKECDEEDFLSEDIAMDEIGDWPDDEPDADIMSQTIEV